ncbi:MAG: GC-type dockerin domain-anchored protein [Phycisphaerae bacterium]
MHNTMKFAALLATSCVTGVTGAQTLHGIMFRTGGQTSGLNPILYDVNTLSGTATNPRNVNVNNCVGIAVDPANGVMYGLTDQFGRINNQSGQGGKNLIFTINPTTGTAAAVGRIDPSGAFQVFEGDIAFNPVDGVMWGVSTLINSARLFRVDKATGLATLGPSISPLIGTDLDISGLAFNAAGELFVLDTRYPNNPGPAIIMKLNPATGATLQSWNTGTLLGNCAGMTFSPGGTLFIADGDTSGTNRLYRFDFAAGSMIDIGPTNAAGGAYRGLAGLVFGCTAARITAPPANASTCPSGGATFTVATANATSIRWQIEDAAATTGWTLITDGPVTLAGEFIGTASGASAASLQFTNVSTNLRTLRFRASASSTCGGETSDPASLTICIGEFNCDGGVDGNDIESFFVAWEAGASSADVNADGGIDGSDVEVFFLRWEGGC